MIDGKYRILRVLGKGGVGTVFVAWNESLQKEVAIKVLSDASPDPGELKRFHAEAQALSACNHPGIVKISAFGLTTDSKPYYVMEFIDGKSLSAEINEHGPLTPARFAVIFDQILSALHHAHCAGLVHRDIKPSNIMLTKDGDEERALLIDFGITRALNRDVKLTATNALVGTPFYMSPEQCMGSKDIDQRSDLYSLGVTMFEASTGKLPFTGETFEVLFAQLNNSPDTVPAELVPLLEGCLAKNPSDRFPNAEAARQSLKSLDLSRFAQFSTGKHALGDKKSLNQKKRSNLKPLVSALSIVAVLSLGAASYYWYQSQQNQQQSEIPSKETILSRPRYAIDKRDPFIQALNAQDPVEAERLKSDFLKRTPDSIQECDLLSNLAALETSKGFRKLAMQNAELASELGNSLPNPIGTWRKLYFKQLYIENCAGSRVPIEQWSKRADDAIAFARANNESNFERKLLIHKAAGYLNAGKCPDMLAAIDECIKSAEHTTESKDITAWDAYMLCASLLSTVKLDPPRAVAYAKTSLARLDQRRKLNLPCDWVSEEQALVVLLSLDLAKETSFLRQYACDLAVRIRQDPNVISRIRGLIYSGLLSFKFGDTEAGRKYMEEAVAVSEKDEPPPKICGAFALHSMLTRVPWTPQENVASMEKALALCGKPTGSTIEPYLVAVQHLGMAYEFAKDYRKALPYHIRASAQAEKLAREKFPHDEQLGWHYLDLALGDRLYAGWDAQETHDRENKLAQINLGFDLLNEFEPRLKDPATKKRAAAMRTFFVDLRDKSIPPTAQPPP